MSRLNFELDGVKIEWIGHATFRISGDKIVYIDPYVIDESPPPADLILVTHEHFDHCDPEAIERIKKSGTIVVGPRNCVSKIPELEVIEEWERKEFLGIEVEAIPAYNPLKRFHPKGSGLGYLVKFGDVTVYHAGDTDYIPEMAKLRGRVTVALLPIGGTYTMDEIEATRAVETIKPKYVIPMHYNFLKGLEKDPHKFAELVTQKVSGVEVIILEPLVKP